MREPISHSLDCPGRRNAAPAHGEGKPAGERVAQGGPVPAPSAARSADSSKDSANTRRPEAILAGLSEHVMDELVDDMADAVVAILLSGVATESGESDDASGSL